MSVDAGIHVKLVNVASDYHAIIDIVKVLSATGWNIFNSGRISYMIVDQYDNYDWLSDYLTLVEFDSILKDKAQKSSSISIEATWDETGIGGPLVFRSQDGYKNISLLLESKRRTIDLHHNYSITDFQWYLEKLLPPLNEAFGIEYFSCEHHI
jgi:hypothetical protein